MNHAIFEHYQETSPLHHLNPAVKLLSSVVVMLFTSLIFDPLTLTGIALFGLLLTLGPGRIPPGLILRGLIPFFLFGIGFFWMNALLPRLADGTEAGADILLTLGPLRFYRTGVRNGVSFGIRSLGFGIYSLLFVATTNPTDFILSLVHQLHLPPRLAYSALAAYRYLPTLHSEIAMIRNAHQVRGTSSLPGPRGVFQRSYRFTIPLLVSGIRRAGRAADAMEARAFTGRNRSWYRQTRLGFRDLLYVIALASGIAFITLYSRHRGSLVFWGGQLWN
ncbi:energy-coupling factor transport system permease protein [Alkalispirochaeta americana]|uniref:Energy-coupling factor transport system permease protein n=1 Tax=Alkalispirochaeta americana TaxID=159291 RepID=A0A1N6QF27_9SPIO|nr:energy-coupling factor transporter transmembrane component T [Alkalispirochaeta americana]SIQ15160.1 energy-coupling factor transport system permease protein [Alkalispirochaeta americana]